MAGSISFYCLSFLWKSNTVQNNYVFVVNRSATANGCERKHPTRTVYSLTIFYQSIVDTMLRCKMVVLLPYNHMEEGHWDLSKVDYNEVEKSQATLVYGQMNEPPGARSSIALSGLTVAESFRDRKNGDSNGPRDILFFIDNIFRFTQAGSEVSALLGRMPSAVGYQPTLATEMGQMQERITSLPRMVLSPRYRLCMYLLMTGETLRSLLHFFTWMQRPY